MDLEFVNIFGPSPVQGLNFFAVHTIFVYFTQLLEFSKFEYTDLNVRLIRTEHFSYSCMSVPFLRWSRTKTPGYTFT